MESNLSKDYFTRAKKVSPGGVHSPVRAFKNVGVGPRFIASAKGAKLTDVDGRQYTDYCMAWGPLILGHADEDVKAAVIKAIERGWSFGATEPYSLELAELITSNIPFVEKIRFVNSGTEAVMSALRLARAATGRDKILKFAGCYHGHVDSMLVKAGSGLAEMASPDSAGLTSAVVADTVVVPLDNLGAVKEAISLNEGKIACAILEPLAANNGLLLPKEGYLKELCALLKAAGILVLFDEVISGFRVGFGGMAAKFEIEPDLVTYGKVIGGGFPVGAFGGRAELMDLVAPLGPVYQAGTLSANPVAMVAGMATLSKLLETNPYDDLAAKTKALGENVIASVKAKTSLTVNVQNLASIFWLVLGDVRTGDGVVRAPDQIPEVQGSIFGKLYGKLLAKGYYLAPSGYEVGFMSCAHTERDNDGLAAAIGEALGEMADLQ